MEDEKIKQLAETLKQQGLAASMFEAIEKAKSILNVSSEKSTGEKNQDRFSKPDYDIKDEEATVNEIMEEVGVTPEEVEDQQREKVSSISAEIHNIKEDLREAEHNPEKVWKIKKEISKVNEEVSEVAKEMLGTSKEESKPKEKVDEEEDRFKEEKTIDLSKIFNHYK